jgi:predicted  nucleic acid-binding Zn-ribbon protein
MSAVVRLGTNGGNDVFGKVKGLINDMIAKLEKQASEDATEKAYCDEQMAKTEAKKSDLDDDIAKLTSNIDQSSAKSAELKEEVKELQAELAALAKEQADMDKIRQEENAAYVTAKADLELGLGGVRKALGVLRDYYGSGAAMLQQPAMPEHHEKSGGAGGSIIGILEVCESDFATNLAKEESEESDAQAAYDKTTQENKIAKTEKEQGVKYKSQEASGLDKAITELSSDRDTANEELDAVMEYYGKIKERCIAKPESYEERKQRREAEIAGLKQALSILENETAFVQQRKRHGSMRGVLAAA